MTEATPEVVGKLLRRSASTHTPCGCEICSASRALSDARSALDRLDDALNAWVEHSEERSMSFAYLVDEVQAVVDGPWQPAESVQRLRRALEVAEWPR